MEKDFDAVKMMREIRDKLNEQYENNPALREQNLKKIRVKYSSFGRKSKSISK